jgi:small subunit ribosomal protein S8
MAVTDPIADFLTRIRNASKARKPRVDIPASSMKKNLADILKKQNFIKDYSLVEDNKQDLIRIELKYTNGAPAISGLKRISRPGLRIYKKSRDLPRVLNGLGVAVISTPGGLLTDKDARVQSVGGEIICYIW